MEFQRRQARHLLQDVPQKELDAASSLRDKQNKIKLAGKTGLIQKDHTEKLVKALNLTGLGLEVEGIDTAAAEALYLACLTGDAEALRACLASCPPPTGPPARNPRAKAPFSQPLAMGRPLILFR